MARTEVTPLGTKLFGYKHSFLDLAKLGSRDQQRALFLVIYRNPYTWLQAMLDRPYAFSESLLNKRLADLVDTELVGIINGVELKGETDPITQSRLSIFKWRTAKIRNFESLSKIVDNVVFLNMEEFLVDPPAMMSALAENFPTLLDKNPQAIKAPPRELMREFWHPKQLEPMDLRAADSSLSWDVEEAIGYCPGSYRMKGRSDD